MEIQLGQYKGLDGFLEILAFTDEENGQKIWVHHNARKQYFIQAHHLLQGRK